MAGHSVRGVVPIPWPPEAATRVAPRALALLGAIVVGSILLRIPFLSVPMITDEGGYAYAAKLWSPEYQLYRDIPFDRPQGIFVLYRLCLTLFGTDVTALRLFAAVYNGLTVAALFFFCRRALSAREAWLAAGLFAIFSTSPQIEGFTANSEIFMLLPTVLAAHATWNRQWFWAGLAGAVAVLVKPSGVAASGLTAAWLLASRAPAAAWLNAGAGVALGLSPAVLHGVWVGWGHFWQSMHEQRLAFYNAETVAPAAQWKAFAKGLTATVSSWAFLAVGAVLGVMRSPSRPTTFGVLWLAFSIGGMAMGGWWREHYFIQLVPPLAFLASRGLSRLRVTPLRIAWVLALAFALALFLRRDLALGLQSGPRISWELYNRPGYLLQDEIAAYVRSVTREEETIQVAFAEAELYHLSGRRAAVPQLFFLPVQHSQSAFDSVVEAIRMRRPSVILLVQPPPPNRMSPGAFLRIVEAGYAEDRVFTVHEDVPSILAFRRRELGGR